VKTVIRHDRATLRKPERTPQGFLRADGLFGRAGIYEYREDNGTIRRELRPLEEVQSPEALASFADASVTLGHPRRADGEPEDVTAENVRKYEVGTVSGAARAEDDGAAGSVTVKDKTAIKKIENGTQELSPGYRIDLDEKPGADPRYAYPGNPAGRYDAIQRKIRVNHLAIVERARGGSACRLRLDEAERVDSAGRMTTAVDGHQHLLDCHDWQGQPVSSGTTSWAVSAGADGGHDHPWVKDATGKITIGESSGHTHELLDEPGAYTSAVGIRADSQFDRSGRGPEHGSMTQPTPSGGSAPPPDAAEQIRLLTVRADEADRSTADQRRRADEASRAAEGLRAELATTKERLKALEVQIAAGTAAVESVAVTEQRNRADAAERELSQLRAKQPALVNKRAGLIAKANAVLGPKFRADSLADRDILVAGIRHLRPREDVGPNVTDEYLERRFDSLVEDRADYSASLSRASEVIAHRREDTAIKPTAPKQPWQDQWKQGAGRFATRKDS
jgi:hypothetical protein